MINVGNGNRLNLFVKIAGDNTGFLRSIRGSNQALKAFKRIAGQNVASVQAYDTMGIKMSKAAEKVKTVSDYLKDSSINFKAAGSSLKTSFSFFKGIFTGKAMARGPAGPNSFIIPDMAINISKLRAFSSSFKFLGGSVKNVFQGIANGFNALRAKFPVLDRIYNTTWGIVKGAAKWSGIMASFAMAKIVKDSIMLGLEFSKTTARFEQLGLKGKEQAKVFGNLKTVAKKYGLAMGEVNAAAVQFYASGIKSGPALAGKISMIADAAMFAGTTFKEMGFVMSKALSAGYMDLTEFWQLNNRGIITLQDLIGKLGRNIEEVMDNISKRKLTTEVAEKIIKEKTAEFNRLANKNLGVAMLKLHNTYAQAQEAMGLGLIKHLNLSAKQVSKFADGLTKKFERLGVILGKTIAKIIPLMQGLIVGFKGVAVTFKNWLSYLMPIINFLSKILLLLTGMKTSVNGVVYGTVNTNNNLQRAGIILGGILATVVTLKSVGMFFKSITFVVKHLKIIWQLIRGIPGLCNKIIELYNRWVILIDAAKIKMIAITVWQKTVKGIQTVINSLTIAWHVIVGWVKKTFTWIKIKMVAVKAMQITLNGLAALWSAILNANPIGLIVAAVVALIALFTTLYFKCKPFKKLCDKIGRAIWSGMVGAIKTFVGWCQKAWNWLKKIWNKLTRKHPKKQQELYNRPMYMGPSQGYAAGTKGFYNKIKGYATGGVVRVNERGGELISLPNGSTVIPHDYTNKLFSDDTHPFDYDELNTIVVKGVEKATKAALKAILPDKEVGYANLY